MPQWLPWTVALLLLTLLALLDPREEPGQEPSEATSVPEDVQVD